MNDDQITSSSRNNSGAKGVEVEQSDPFSFMIKALEATVEQKRKAVEEWRTRCYGPASRYQRRSVADNEQNKQGLEMKEKSLRLAEERLAGAREAGRLVRYIHLLYLF